MTTPAAGDRMRRVSYRIDGGDYVVSVSESWAAFAATNGANDLATGVLRHSLWDFVSDDTTRQVYRELIGRVRTGRTVGFYYRCDAPALRRFMRMTMGPTTDGLVEFDSVIVRTEPRAVPLLAEAPSVPSGGLVRICSWCRRAAVDGEWVELEVAVERLKLFAGQPLAPITHAMCPECETRVMAELDAA